MRSATALGRLSLDLGDLRNLAQVRLNGRDLGVVWTPPFRVEISGAVKAAGNVLEIDVVNTWYNRLIKDLTLPPAERLSPDQHPSQSRHNAGRFRPARAGEPCRRRRTRDAQRP